MAESAASNNALYVADSSGDIILVVGASITPDNKLGIQVSSHVLGLVSTVFKAMFSSRYHEEAMLNATAAQPVSISLPEDDPEAVKLACRMFHYQLDDTFEQPSLKVLDKLAMFCDKYDCARSVRPTIRLWGQPYYSLEGVGFNNLLVVSYMFDDPIFFGRITQELVCRYAGNYMDFVSEHGRNILPSCLCFALEQKRKELNNRINVAVQELIKPVITSHQTSVAAYFRELYRIGVYPSDLSTSVDSTIAHLKHFDSSILKTVNCGCHQCFKIGDLSEAVRKIGAQARSWAESICLDCIRHGGRNTGKCRIDHV